jgi:glycosyltransferase involved in cell wall biosynthesis
MTDDMTTSASATRPLATIIMRAFNQEAFVVQAIDSCFAQTYSPLEIILSDDCSSDGTWEVIRRAAAAYQGPHRVRINRNERNLGIVAHTNKTMAMASGTLILSCAGDDIAFPQKTERLVSAWREDPERIRAVHSAAIEMSFSGQDMRVITPRSFNCRILEPDAFDVGGRNAWVFGAATMWHRDVIDVFGPIPEVSAVEDNPLLFRATLLGTVRYVDEPLFRKRVGGVSDQAAEAEVRDFARLPHLKLMRWSRASLKAFLEDLDKVDVAGKAELRQLVLETLERYEFEVQLQELGPAARLLKLPVAITKTLGSRDGFYLRRALVHAFRLLYMTYRRVRYASRMPRPE